MNNETHNQRELIIDDIKFRDERKASEMQHFKCGKEMEVEKKKSTYPKREFANSEMKVQR